MDWIMFIVRQGRGLAGGSNRPLTIATGIIEMIKVIYGL
jgi:hypothetical protein